MWCFHFWRGGWWRTLGGEQRCHFFCSQGHPIGHPLGCSQGHALGPMVGWDQCRKQTGILDLAQFREREAMQQGQSQPWVQISTRLITRWADPLAGFECEPF